MNPYEKNNIIKCSGASIRNIFNMAHISIVLKFALGFNVQLNIKHNRSQIFKTYVEMIIANITPIS